MDASKTIGENSGFWKALGSDYLFKIVNEPIGHEFLNRAQKSNSVVYYRTHYTFNSETGEDQNAGGSVCGRVLTIDDQGNYHYDFSTVNKTFKEYVDRGMKPVVEFDFYPTGLAAKDKGGPNDESFESDDRAPADWEKWEELLNKFMQNLVDTFGKEEMRTWYYEVWNEPDSWPVEQLPVFFRLYDVFANVVKSYDKDFKVGGPACYNLYFMEYFLQHVVKGTNFVTGEKGSPLDFVSHHVYGLSGAWLSKPPEIVPQVSRFTVELLWVERMLNRHHLKGKVEFLMNEWGVCSNFKRTVAEHPQLVYRNSEFSALFMVKLVDCLYGLEDNFKFKTTMMAYWGFCVEATWNVMFAGNRDLMTGGNIPKPILIAYEMLAMLGEKRLAVEDLVIGSRFAQGERFGIIPTRDDNRIVFIVYNFCETDDDLDRIDDIVVNLSNLPSGKTYKWEEILMDDKHNNSYSLWIENGRPENPSELTPDFLSKAREIEVTKSGSVSTGKNGIATIEIPLKRHSMKLYELKLKE